MSGSGGSQYVDLAASALRPQTLTGSCPTRAWTEGIPSSLLLFLRQDLSKADLKLQIPLYLSPEGWDCRCVPPCMADLRGAALFWYVYLVCECELMEIRGQVSFQPYGVQGCQAQQQMLLPTQPSCQPWSEVLKMRHSNCLMISLLKPTSIPTAF